MTRFPRETSVADSDGEGAQRDVSPGKHTRAGVTRVSDQFDLFLPFLSDLPLRDTRETMERPFFSLAKSKRVKPIDYTSPDGKVWVYVSANADYGMATIWDADILIYIASMIADMRRRGANDIPQTIHFMPYDMLRLLRRPTTGRSYQLLAQALDRLQSTSVKTNIRAANRKETTFSWIDSYTHIVDERTERTRGMSITLARWFYDGLMSDGSVLSIDPDYFEISGGRERWLYRVARKHAGGAGEGGFAISMPTLFEKSGAEGTYRRFKFEILAIARKDELPGYALTIEQSGAEPSIRMTRRDAMLPAEPRSKPAPRKAAKPPAASSTDVSEAAIQRLRVECPGWDYDNLEALFREWIGGDPTRLPANYDKAFEGWVRRYHERHKHELPGY